MENNSNHLPKRNFLSTQIDLRKFEKATDAEKAQQDIMSESTTFFKDGMKRLFRNPLAVLSIVLLILILATIIFVPMIVPYSYDEILKVDGKRDRGAQNLAPFEYSELEQEYIANGGERFPISSERMSFAEITSSVSSTARGFPLQSVFSPASSFL